MPVPPPRKPIDFHDLEIMARTIYGEARGETLRGRRAVACVIMNRAIKAQEYFEKQGKIHPLFGNGAIYDACQRPYQFSCWLAKDPNLSKLLSVRPGDRTLGECIGVAIMVIEDSLTDRYAGRDPSCGSLHYYVRGSPMPKWHQGQAPCAILGAHLFFNNIR